MDKKLIYAAGFVSAAIPASWYIWKLKKEKKKLESYVTREVDSYVMEFLGNYFKKHPKGIKL